MTEKKKKMENRRKMQIKSFTLETSIGNITYKKKNLPVSLNYTPL